MAEASREEYDPIGYEQVTLPGVLTIPTDARYCVVQAEGANVRWRDDGSVPTSSSGMLLTDGSSLPYAGDLESLKLIGVSGSPKVNVSYYR